MKDVLPLIKRWTMESKPFAMARVLETWGSSPRPVGAALLISSSGELAGSVSGGCVEGAVVKEAKSLIGTGGFKILNYGVTDDEAWTVGLSCGGKIKLLLQDYTDSNSSKPLQSLAGAIDHHEGCVFITEFSGDKTNECVLAGDRSTDREISESVKFKADVLLRKRRSEVIRDNGLEYFIQVFPEKSQLLIIGAAHITVDLVHLAAAYDFETTVIDPRGAFTGKTQFETKPDHMFESYPSEVLGDLSLDENTYAVVLSHDPKIDDNALQILLRSPVAYIGALGSRKTHEKRMARLQEAGFTQGEIARVESPIGTDIHATGAKEIALSIMGSLIRVRNS